MSGRRRPSLSRRLLVGLLVVSCGYWSVITWLTIDDTIEETYRLFDTHLAQTAFALLRVADPDETDPTGALESTDAPTIAELFPNWKGLAERIAEIRSPTRKPPTPAGSPGGTAAGAGSRIELLAEYERRTRYQIWDSQGTLLLRSANAPDEPLTLEDGFSEDVDAHGSVWRHYAIWDVHRDVRVVVSEAHDIRHRLVRRIALSLVSPLLLGLPVLGLLLWLSIRHGLNPLDRLTEEIAQRQAGDLSPLDPADAPAEVRPAILAFNGFLGRFSQVLESERLFTANAAHELRTPLAAIQAHLHAARHATGADGREQALAQVQRGVERGSRLVGQLLALARLDPDQPLQDAAELDPGKEMELVCAQLSPLALARDQTLELDVAPDTPKLRGNADMFAMLLGNLVDNAIHYSPAGASIKVRAYAQAGAACVEVTDDGPGIPPEQRQRVFERFYRLARQDQAGTGLGLAICRRIAELHGAEVSLDAGPGGKGLRALVRFPPAPSRAEDAATPAVAA